MSLMGKGQLRNVLLRSRLPQTTSSIKVLITRRPSQPPARIPIFTEPGSPGIEYKGNLLSGGSSTWRAGEVCVLQFCATLIEKIAKEIRAEIDRLHAALAALTGNSTKPRGRRKRTLSAAARRTISLSQKARWAKRAARPKRSMSVSARKKIAAAQRARWAKVKAGKM